MTQSRPEPQSCSDSRCESASAISISVASLVHCRAKSRYAALAHGLVAAAANSTQRRERARHSSGSPGMADCPWSGLGRPWFALGALSARKSSKKVVSGRSESAISARDMNHSIEHGTIDAAAAKHPLPTKSDNARSRTKAVSFRAARAGVACTRRQSDAARVPPMTWSTSQCPGSPGRYGATIWKLRPDIRTSMAVEAPAVAINAVIGSIATRHPDR